MRNLLPLMFILLLFSACSREEPAQVAEQVTAPDAAETVTAVDPPADAFDEAAATRKAKSAIMLFAGELQAEFGAAMKDGGPVSAIEVCNTRAMAITERISEEKGLNLGRVSHKNRNPLNAPNDWQSAVLLEFEERHAAGEELTYISWSEVAGEGEDREFRFMKPIPTHAICVNCHGTSITPEVKAVLARLYPDDMATGFSPGDMRGAFVVTRPVGE